MACAKDKIFLPDQLSLQCGFPDWVDSGGRRKWLLTVLRWSVEIEDGRDEFDIGSVWDEKNQNVNFYIRAQDMVVL
jgi:hypothetical protein